MEGRQHVPRALIIVHEPDCPGALVETRLEERGYAVHSHVVCPDPDEPDRSRAFPDPSDYDLIVAMGSERSLTRRHEIAGWIDAELDLLRTAHDADTPLLGICFGGQAIAEALGGTVTAASETELGWYRLRTQAGQENPLGSGPWMEWHHDVFTAPPGSTVLAETDQGPQIFVHGRTVGLQFHPEVDIDVVVGWLDEVDDAYLAAAGRDRDSVLAEAARHMMDNATNCRRLVDWFLDDVAFPKDPRPSDL